MNVQNSNVQPGIQQPASFQCTLITHTQAYRLSSTSKQNLNHRHCEKKRANSFQGPFRHFSEESITDNAGQRSK